MIECSTELVVQTSIGLFPTAKTRPSTCTSQLPDSSQHRLGRGQTCDCNPTGQATHIVNSIWTYRAMETGLPPSPRFSVRPNGESNIRFGFGERERGWQSTTTRRILRIRQCTTTANSVKKARGSSQGVESTPTTFLPTGAHATSASRQVKLAWVSWRPFVVVQ